MTENTCSNQNSLLDTLRAIPEGKQVRFHLRRPDGSEFTHVSAIDTDRDSDCFPGGFDSSDNTIALLTEIEDCKPHYLNGWWVKYHGTGPYMHSIVAIEQLAPALPDLDTLRKWVADGTKVRIAYAHDIATADFVGPSPVTCKLLEVRSGDFGVAVRVPTKGPGKGWNMFLDPAKGEICPCRPLVTSITPVADIKPSELAQTAEEIDTIMQRAAREGTRVEAVTAVGETHIGDVLDDGSPVVRYRIPADGNGEHSVWWLGAGSDRDVEDERRIVSVRELAAEKQTEAEMLALLQQAEREGYHVEATMADGSKRTGAISLDSLYDGRMTRCFIADKGASFRAYFDSDRIAAVKLLPREEKHPTIQVKLDASASDHVVTFSTVAATLASVFAEAFSLTPGPTVTIEVPKKTHITPTCLADVYPHIGRRVCVRCPGGATSEQEGKLTRAGLDSDGDPTFWLDDDHGYDGWCVAPEYCELTIELLPDEPASANLMIEPTCPADLEPYIGRRVRVLAGSERELVREGTLMDANFLSLKVEEEEEEEEEGWYYGPGGDRSTLVEVLPEEPDDSEDDHDDDLENEDEDGHAIVAVSVESKLTLAELLRMAPPPNDVRCYEAFQDTVRTAITTGLVTA